jgi:mRNA-degrading endonuclease RelE of RelBE toxin-antitoxin system
MKRLAFAPAANRQIAGLAADVREEMLGALEAYAEGIANLPVDRLEGVDRYRLRVGEHRAIFIETKSAITVTAIGHRSSIYDRIRRWK